LFVVLIVFLNVFFVDFAGKMRMNHIRVLLGDKVRLVLDSYGGKARIIKRL
jgi:translation initiation factor IF-1